MLSRIIAPKRLERIVLLGSIAFSACTMAQAPVVDRVSQSGASNASADRNAIRSNYLEIQALREEISLLRGMIEEQTYQVQKLQRQQQEDYENLDQRLLSGGAGISAGSSSGPGVEPSNAIPNAQQGSAGVVASADAEALYQQGFSALRLGDRAAATAAFEDLLANYPNSQPEADALYWLGETRWLDVKLEESRQSFSTLVEQYPAYRKVDDAKYRLGLIYDQLGDSEQAAAYMKTVAAGDSNQAASAKSYLQEKGLL